MKLLPYAAVFLTTVVCASPANWTAQWIGAPLRGIAQTGNSSPKGVTTETSAPVTNLWTCLRKRFVLDRKPQSAIARIAVDSRYWLWVNGRLAVYEGELKRGPNPRDTYFDVVNLTSYLRHGTNTIAALTWYWGKNGFSHKSSGKAAFVFQLNCDGRSIDSDSTWKALRNPAYGSTGAPHPNYRLSEENIHFDARLELGDWKAPNYDDSAWPAAVTFGKPPCAPWHRLIQRPIPLWRVGRLTKYVNARELPRVSDGKPIIARLPRNITLSPYLKIKAPAGLTIDIRTDDYRVGGPHGEPTLRTKYITRKGVQEFESLEYLNGHWVIYTIPRGVQILALRYRETRYDTDFSGRFKCDDPFFNTLWQKARNTLNLNMRDSIQDPDRERAQWWGDAVIDMGEMFYACGDRAHALMRKAIDNLVDWQKPNGVLYSPVPAGSWNKELPQQMLAAIGKYGFWEYYLYTGDKATIAHAYPAVKRYLALWHLDRDGLVVHRRGGWDWADWGQNIDTRVLDNSWFCLALDGAAHMAEVLGQNADAADYQRERATVIAAVNREYWNGTAYRDPNYKGKTDDRANGLAVVAGIARPQQFPAIEAVLAHEYQASPYMEKYILESLFQMGDADAALARMKKRYRKMVVSQYTTLWELFSGARVGSYNHGWAGGPLTLLSEYVAGVAPTSPAYATYQVRPQLGPLRQVQATVPTVRGSIGVNIVRAAGRFTLTLSSPPGTQASVWLPVTGAVRINGEPAATVAGVKFRGHRGDHQVFEVQPGRWKFVASEAGNTQPKAP